MVNNCRIFIIFFFCLTFTLFIDTAEAKVLSNSTYQTGQSITLNGTTYQVSVSISNSTGLVLRSGNTTYSFGIGECMLFFDEMFCYASKTGSTARLTVYSQDAALLVKRVVTKATKLSVGTPYSLNITLNNTGRSEAADINLEARYPSGFQVREISGCTAVGNAIIWKGKLKERNTFECQVVLIPLWEAEGIITTNVTYRTLSGAMSEDLDDIELEVTVPNWFMINISPKVTGLGGIVDIWMNFSANDTTNLSIKSVQIPLSDHFIFLESTYRPAEVRRNILSFGKNIKQNTSFLFHANISPIMNGTLPLNISITYEEGEERTFIRQYEVNVTALPLEVTIERDLKGALEPGRQEHFKVMVRNPNIFYDVSHYEVTVTSGLPGLDAGFYKAEIGDSLTRRIVYDHYYSVPLVNQTASYIFDVSVTGYDGLIQTLSGHAAESVEIFPLGELTILKGLNFSNVEGKNRTMVKVFVKSSYARTISDLKVQETLPEPFYYKGDTEAIIDVKPGALVEAYSYELSVPYKVEMEGSVGLGTLATYEYNDKAYSSNASVEADIQVIHDFLYPAEKPAEALIPPAVEQPIQEEKGGLVRIFIIFDIFLVVIAVSYLLGINLFVKGKAYGKSMTLALRERRVNKSDEEISHRLEALSKEEQQIQDESRKVESLIVDLEREIGRQNRTIPQELGKNDSRTKDLEIQFARLEEKKQVFEKKIGSLKMKEDDIIKRQQEVMARKAAISKMNEELRQKKIKIIADINAFKDKLLSLHDNLESMKHKKDDASGHREGLHKARLEVIQKRLAQLEDEEKTLIEKENKIEAEKKRMKEESQSIERHFNILRREK